MNNPYNLYIFALLGEYFNELLAVTLITQLRREGLRVKVVLLCPPTIEGYLDFAKLLRTIAQIPIDTVRDE